MLLKDKITLVFYIGSKGLQKFDAIKRVIDAREYFRGLKDDSSEFIFLPDYYDENDHIEAINPKVISEEDFAKVEHIIEKLKRKIDEIQY